MAAASSHTHKYANSNVSTQGSTNGDQLQPGVEPIYQNQAELRQQLQQLDKRLEPIYQNLPAHEKMLLIQHSKQDLLLNG
jgi:hypothetical protein